LRMPVAPAIVAGMTSCGFGEKDMTEAVWTMVSNAFYGFVESALARHVFRDCGLVFRRALR
jgi:hypothetical protein